VAKPPTPQPLTLDAFRAENRYQGGTCTLHAFLQTLSEADRETVLAAVRDTTIQSTAVVRVLKTRGYQYTHQVVDRHRRAGCRDCRIAPR